MSLLFFLLIGRFLDQRCACALAAKRRICSSLQGGIATVIETDGARRRVAAHALRPGDRLLVATGERVAADGVILAGTERDRSEPDHGRDGPGRRRARRRDLCRHAQSRSAARGRGRRPPTTRTLLAEIGRLMLAAEQGKARYRRLADRAARDLCARRARTWACHLPRLDDRSVRHGRRR